MQEQLFWLVLLLLLSMLLNVVTLITVWLVWSRLKHVEGALGEWHRLNPAPARWSSPAVA